MMIIIMMVKKWETALSWYLFWYPSKRRYQL
jgi:hypothetical protein